jgi:hypothetical protein
VEGGRAVEHGIERVAGAEEPLPLGEGRVAMGETQAVEMQGPVS